MPLKRSVVRVDPQGKSMVVDILDTSGVSVVAYDSSQFAAARLALPMTITGQTDFCLPSPGPYDVSCKVGGTEVANAGAAKRVQAGDTPVRLVPDWERELAGADSAASGEAFSVIIRSGAAEPDNTFVTMPQPLTGTELIGRTVNHPIGTVAPAGGFRCEFDGPVDVQASLDFYVYSADGSQILERSIVSDSLITANSPGPTRFIDFDQPNVQKGSDLSWDPVTKQIVSASGGIFGAVIWAQYHLPA